MKLRNSSRAASISTKSSVAVDIVDIVDIVDRWVQRCSARRAAGWTVPVNQDRNYFQTNVSLARTAVWRCGRGQVSTWLATIMQSATTIFDIECGQSNHRAVFMFIWIIFSFLTHWLATPKIWWVCLCNFHTLLGPHHAGMMLMLAARQRQSQKHYEAPNFRNITPSVSLGCVKTQCSYIYGEERTGHPDCG